MSKNSESEFDFDNILKLSKLSARNALEKAQLEDSFTKILKHIDVIKNYKTDSELEMTHVHDTINNVRDDIITEKLDIDLALQNAPDKKDRYFKTPLIISTKKDNTKKDN